MSAARIRVDYGGDDNCDVDTEGLLSATLVHVCDNDDGDDNDDGGTKGVSADVFVKPPNGYCDEADFDGEDTNG